MIFEKIKKSYFKKKYLILNKAINLGSFELQFNFDSMFQLWSMNNNLDFKMQNGPFMGQIMNINNISIFKNYLNYMNQNLLDYFKIGKLDFFYSLKGMVGTSHVDEEDVIILGIKNVTYYHIDNIDLKIEPGDVLYIPQGFRHHSFSARERIVLSLSLWKK